jgi:hypothetical protein
VLDDLAWSGPFHFHNWPTDEVPPVAAGVYAIWDDDLLVYVGMSGRGRTRQDLEDAQGGGRRVGLWTRLNSHASGRRSGDQFCVYVADHLVLPMLTAGQVEGIASGKIRLDDLTRSRVRDHMSFRFLITPDGESAAALERELRAGALGTKPSLNPA